jgi:hypothetical protein
MKGNIILKVMILSVVSFCYGDVNVTAGLYGMIGLTRKSYKLNLALIVLS